MRRPLWLLGLAACCLTWSTSVSAGPVPTWDKIINGPGRFKLVMGGAAALDKETGLVWELSPATSTALWRSAMTSCIVKTVGGRKGWRAPAVEELLTLIDPMQSNPALPTGHPFQNVQNANYWSGNSNASDGTFALSVSVGSSGAGDSVKTNSHLIWCVRGGQLAGDTR